jgi:hypothetical protein
MHVARRLASACLIVAALMGMAAVPAQAQDEVPITQVIFRDYALDRVIDGSYDADDLSAALELARDDPAFSEFADAVQETYDRDILGLSTTPRRQPSPFAEADPGSGFLPSPRPPGERDQPPWPFLALTALAGALVLTGAGSSILRRARR